VDEGMRVTVPRLGGQHVGRSPARSAHWLAKGIWCLGEGVHRSAEGRNPLPVPTYFRDGLRAAAGRSALPTARTPKSTAVMTCTAVHHKQMASILYNSAQAR
jgi:hypothetical protein